jgi:DNA-binding transcriptional LysR family regulator
MTQIERVSRRLKLRQLDVLLAVGRSGSMAKAADDLAITQPVVSKSIADLEKLLGVRLFDRTPRGVEPTLYGRALIKRSIAVFNDLRTSVNELEFLSDSATGELRIGSSESIAAGMLGVIIDRLSRRYPRLNFEVVLGGDMVELPHYDLRTRNIDLIIGRLPSAIPDDMEATFLYIEQAHIAAGANNPLTRRRQVRLSELINEFWCGPSFDNFPWSLAAAAFVAAGLKPPQNLVRARSMLMRNSLLATGRFLTIYPRTVLYFGAKNLSLKRVPADLLGASYPVGIITLKNRTLNPVATRFIDCAREVAKPFMQKRSGREAEGGPGNGRR